MHGAAQCNGANSQERIPSFICPDIFQKRIRSWKVLLTLSGGSRKCSWGGELSIIHPNDIKGARSAQEFFFLPPEWEPLPLVDSISYMVGGERRRWLGWKNKDLKLSKWHWNVNETKIIILQEIVKFFRISYYDRKKF